MNWYQTNDNPPKFYKGMHRGKRKPLSEKSKEILKKILTYQNQIKNERTNHKES